MYSESDLEGAVAAGVLAGDAVALPPHIAHRFDARGGRRKFPADHRFQRIFVASPARCCSPRWRSLGDGSTTPLGRRVGRPVAAWGLAEYFTRYGGWRCPASCCCSPLSAVAALVGGLIVDNRIGWSGDEAVVATIAIAGLARSAGAWLHWRRFKVPITVAAGAAALVAAVIAADRCGDERRDKRRVNPLILVGGPRHVRSGDVVGHERPQARGAAHDVAFWLHLLAAPMIVHPIFHMLGVTEGDLGGGAVLVIALYIAIAGIALAIDRRALMVSSLAYVLCALNGCSSGSARSSNQSRSPH